MRRHTNSGMTTRRKTVADGAAAGAAAATPINMSVMSPEHAPQNNTKNANHLHCGPAERSKPASASRAALACLNRRGPEVGAGAALRGGQNMEC
mmetsp:Transcript_2077/g.5196  ORF Transcript_2077/g.5196 Transcript_2077/m.5196 type:complete len:94 (+) Transcript_2077:165-446(+)